MSIHEHSGMMPIPFIVPWHILNSAHKVRGGECPVIPPVHPKGVALPQQRSSRTLRALSNLRAYIVHFLRLRDFFI